MQAKPFVKIQNVCFQYPGSDTKVLNGASLTIEEGSSSRLSVEMVLVNQLFVKR